MAMLKTRYSLLQLLLLTAGVAVFCVILMNENRWLRATYVTAALCITLNALIAAIFARGERQVFSIGFVVGIVFFGFASYSAMFTLPYLLTMELYERIQESAGAPPSEDHFAIVMVVFWVMLTATSSGLISRTWHRSVQRGRRELDMNEVDSVGG